jgi:hypothetical protein
MAYAYFKADGSILSVSRNELDYGDSSIIVAELPEMLNANMIYLDLETQQVKAREPFPIEVSFNRIDNVPVGTTVTEGDDIQVCDDGSVEYETDTPETLIVTLSHPHFIEQYVTVQIGPEVS